MAKVYVNQVDKNKCHSKEEYAEQQHANFEYAFKKFKKEVLKEGTLKECRDRMYYISKSEKKKAKAKAGRRKQLKKMWQEKRYEEYDY